MIVSTTTHRRALDELATERGRREELSRRCDVQQTTIEFLISRVNQLEKERALTFRRLTDIEIPVPSFSTPRAEAASLSDDPIAALNASASIFEDDPKHAPSGWNPDGTVNYGPPRKVG